MRSCPRGVKRCVGPVRGALWRLLRLSRPVSGGVSRFCFLRGVGGGILWWALPIERPGVSGVRRKVGVCVWVGCGVLLSEGFCFGLFWGAGCSCGSVWRVLCWFWRRVFGRMCGWRWWEISLSGDCEESSRWSGGFCYGGSLCVVDLGYEGGVLTSEGLGWPVFLGG